MKDLSKFTKVIEVLSKVASESTVSNGTNGMELLCHYWRHEDIADKPRQDLETDIAKLVLQSANIELIKAKQAQLKALEPPKIMMIFKLLDKIPRLEGTKIVYDGEKARHPVMNNVDELYASEDSIKLGLLKYEETGDKATDSMGRETPIIKLKVEKGLIDVKEAIYDRNHKLVRAARASVTAISFKSMQVAGKLLWNENETKRKFLGFGDSE